MQIFYWTIEIEVDIAKTVLNYWYWIPYCRNVFYLLRLKLILKKYFWAIEIEVDIAETLVVYWYWSWYCTKQYHLLILKLMLWKHFNSGFGLQLLKSKLFTMQIRLSFCNNIEKILKDCNTIVYYWYRYWSWYCTNFFWDIEIEVDIAEPFLSYWNWSWCCIYFCDLLILKLILKNLFWTIDIEVDIAKPNLNYWYWGWYRGIFLR